MLSSGNTFCGAERERRKNKIMARASLKAKAISTGLVHAGNDSVQVHRIHGVVDVDLIFRLLRLHSGCRECRSLLLKRL